MIVLVVLPTIVIIATQALVNVLSGQRKIESEVQSRETIEYIFANIGRKVFNAQDISCSPDQKTLTFEKDIDSFGKFVCDTSNGKIDYYDDINGGSTPLNKPTVIVDTCYFTCLLAGANSQPGVKATISVIKSGQEDIETGQLELTNTFYTRSY